MTQTNQAQCVAYYLHETQQEQKKETNINWLQKILILTNGKQSRIVPIFRTTLSKHRGIQSKMTNMKFRHTRKLERKFYVTNIPGVNVGSTESLMMAGRSSKDSNPSRWVGRSKTRVIYPKKDSNQGTSDYPLLHPTLLQGAQSGDNSVEG
jgi:hypothetical protein